MVWPGSLIDGDWCHCNAKNADGHEYDYILMHAANKQLAILTKRNNWIDCLL